MTQDRIPAGPKLFPSNKHLRRIPGHDNRFPDHRKSKLSFFFFLILKHGSFLFMYLVFNLSSFFVMLSSKDRYLSQVQLEKKKKKLKDIDTLSNFFSLFFFMSSDIK